MAPVFKHFEKSIQQAQRKRCDVCFLDAERDDLCSRVVKNCFGKQWVELTGHAKFHYATSQDLLAY